LLFAEGDEIEAKDLPEELRPDLKLAPARPVRAAELPAIEAGNASMKDIVRQATEEIERDLIQKALDETGGNVTRAASLLGISRKGLQNKMKEFGLRDPENKT
jgi:two-component system, NtrC family, response regulator AtoC